MLPRTQHDPPRKLIRRPARPARAQSRKPAGRVAPGDTGAGDTGAGDTGLDDTGASDTGASDTGSDDTGSGDTGPDPTCSEAPTCECFISECAAGLGVPAATACGVLTSEESAPCLAKLVGVYQAGGCGVACGGITKSMWGAICDDGTCAGVKATLTGAGVLTSQCTECLAGCTADCAGKACGNDGCGGSCGTCGDGGERLLRVQLHRSRPERHVPDRLRWREPRPRDLPGL